MGGGEYYIAMCLLKGHRFTQSTAVALPCCVAVMQSAGSPETCDVSSVCGFYHQADGSYMCYGACVSAVPCCAKFCYFDSHIVRPFNIYEQSSSENPYDSFNKYVLSGNVLNTIEIINRPVSYISIKTLLIAFRYMLN